MSDAEPTVGGLPLASPWKRFAGATIDGVIFVVLGLSTLSAEGSAARGIGIAWFVIAAVYEIGLTATRGQTLGKMAVATQVLDHSGERLPAWNQAVVRWLVPSVPSLFGLFIVGLGMDLAGVAWSVVVFLPILRTAEHRGWHDRAAGTVVIDRALVTVD